MSFSGDPRLRNLNYAYFESDCEKADYLEREAEYRAEQNLEEFIERKNDLMGVRNRPAAKALLSCVSGDVGEKLKD